MAIIVRFEFDISGGDEVGAFASLAHAVREPTTLITVQPVGPGEGNPRFFVTVLDGGDDVAVIRRFFKAADIAAEHVEETRVTARTAADAVTATVHEAAASESAQEPVKQEPVKQEPVES